MEGLSNPRILVIDDEDIVLESCRRIMEIEGYGFTGVKNGADGVERLKREPYSLVITDLKMPGLSGMEVLQVISEAAPEVPVVVITGYASIPSAVEAMKRGAFDYLKKPFTPQDLLYVVKRGVEEHSRRLEARRREEVKRQIITALHNALNPMDILKVLVQSIREITRARGALAGLISPRGGHLGPVESVGIPSMLEDRITRDPNAAEGLALDGGEGERNGQLLSWDISFRERILGKLFLAWDETPSISPQESKDVGEVCVQAAHALDASLSYERLSQEAETLREELWEWYEYEAWKEAGSPPSGKSRNGPHHGS